MIARYEAARERLSTPLPDHFNIAAACCDRWADDRDRVAMLVPDGDRVTKLTFAAFADWSARVANGLAALGVDRGDRVAVCLPQSPQCATAHLAIHRLGAIAVPISPMSGTEALRHRIEDSGARVLIGSATTNPELAESELADTVTLVLEGTEHAAVSWQRLLEDGSATCPPVETGIDDPAILIYTSGTSGPPKGALHAQRVVPAHAEPVALAHDLFPQDEDLLWSPADWAWGGGLIDCLLAAWNAGKPIVAWRPRGFDPAAVVDMLARSGVRNTFLPPTALKLLRDSADLAPSLRALRLRSVMTGGERCGPDLIAWSAETLGTIPNEVYGQTEASMVLGNSHTLLDVRPGSLGMPYPRARLAVLDDEGEPVPRGTIGEIAIHTSTPAMFLGYWQATVPPGEWHRTGDLGRIDEDGYHWHEGRRDDVILTSGYRVGPGEIEDCLARHPAIRAVAVIGEPDERRGEAITAVVELRDGAPAPDLEDELRLLVRSQLAPYEVPRRFRFVDALPRTQNGKLRRAALRRERGGA